MKPFRISFNSITPPNSSSHFLAFRQLKSYLAFKGIAHHFDIRFNLFATDTPNREISHEILSQNVELAAFSVYTWNVSKISEICGIVKKKPGKIMTVAGGPYVTFMADELMTDGRMDLLVKGAGEDVFYRILNQFFLKGGPNFSHIPNLIYRDNGNPVETGQDHFFDVSRQHYQLIVEDGDSDIFYYETSRGCPFKCHFCTWSASNGVIRFYPRKKIESDLGAVFDLPHVKHLGLCDSELFVNSGHGLWVLRLIRRLNRSRRRKGLPEINLSFEINPQRTNHEIIHELLNLPPGINIISCGLQTIDEQINTRHLNREFNKETYFRNLKQIYETAKERGLFEQAKKTVFIEIMHGLPGESYEGFRKTLDFLLTELNINHFISYRFQVLPGSYFWEHAEEYDLVYEKNPPHYLVSSSTFSREDLEKSERLVFFLYLFSKVFKGIMRFVEKNVTDNHLRIYEQIMNHLSLNYPELVSELLANYHPTDEDETIIKMVNYQTEKQFYKLKFQIIREAREIVRSNFEPRIPQG
jgi:radical SAM superfamily enzyme YgiQ (UPF0313 family)